MVTNMLVTSKSHKTSPPLNLKSLLCSMEFVTSCPMKALLNPELIFRHGPSIVDAFHTCRFYETSVSGFPCCALSD